MEGRKEGRKEEGEEGEEGDEIICHGRRECEDAI